MADRATRVGLRAACERRVYRLATLLTGDAGAGVDVLESVLADRKDLGRLDAAHLDRLTVLRSRERGRVGRLADANLDPEMTDILHALPMQPREAWLLTWVDTREDREAARAMDCSVTATRRHLEHADTLLVERLGRTVVADAATRLHDFADALDVPPIYHVRQRRRRLRRRVVVGVLVGIAIIAGLVAFALLR